MNQSFETGYCNSFRNNCSSYSCANSAGYFSSHVMYTIVDRYYMTMKERLGASLF